MAETDVTLTGNDLLIMWTQSGRTEPQGPDWFFSSKSRKMYPGFVSPHISQHAFICNGLQEKTFLCRLSFGPAPTQSVFTCRLNSFFLPESFLSPHKKRFPWMLLQFQQRHQPAGAKQPLGTKPYANQPERWWSVPTFRLWIKALAEGLSGRPTSRKPLPRPLWSPKACARLEELVYISMWAAL